LLRSRPLGTSELNARLTSQAMAASVKIFPTSSSVSSRGVKSPMIRRSSFVGGGGTGGGAVFVFGMVGDAPAGRFGGMVQSAWPSSSETTTDAAAASSGAGSGSGTRMWRGSSGQVQWSALGSWL